MKLTKEHWIAIGIVIVILAFVVIMAVNMGYNPFCDTCEEALKRGLLKW